MYLNLDECLCCKNSEFDVVGENQYNNKKLSLVFDYHVLKCKKCGHVQSDKMVDRKLLYDNYQDSTGTKKDNQKYFDWFSDFVIEYCDPRNVLDIGCNDGSQLDYFNEKGIKTFGVDPSSELYKVNSQDHRIIQDYFKAGLYKNQKFDCIISKDLVDKLDNLEEFFDTCEDLMTDKSYLFVHLSRSKIDCNVISEFRDIELKDIAADSCLCMVDMLKHEYGTTYIFSKPDFKINAKIEMLLNIGRWK